jgi:hypothetical protein
VIEILTYSANAAGVANGYNGVRNIAGVQIQMVNAAIVV